jgi:hypothetical protein
MSERRSPRVKSESRIVEHFLEGTYIGSPGVVVTQGVGENGRVDELK